MLEIFLYHFQHGNTSAGEKNQSLKRNLNILLQKWILKPKERKTQQLSPEAC